MVVVQHQICELIVCCTASSHSFVSQSLFASFLLLFFAFLLFGPPVRLCVICVAPFHSFFAQSSLQKHQQQHYFRRRPVDCLPLLLAAFRPPPFQHQQQCLTSNKSNHRIAPSTVDSSTLALVQSPAFVLYLFLPPLCRTLLPSFLSALLLTLLLTHSLIRSQFCALCNILFVSIYTFVNHRGKKKTMLIVLCVSVSRQLGDYG